jgi:hypothetical protein
MIGPLVCQYPWNTSKFYQDIYLLGGREKKTRYDLQDKVGTKGLFPFAVNSYSLYS